MVLGMSEFPMWKGNIIAWDEERKFKGQIDLDLNPDLMKKYQLCGTGQAA